MTPGRSKSTKARRAVVVGTSRLSRAIADSFDSDRGAGSVLGFAAPDADDIPIDGMLDGRPVASVERATALWADVADLVLVGGSPDAGAGGARWRRTVFHALLRRGLPVGGFVHRAAWVLPGARIAASAIILDGAYVEPLSSVGPNAVLECDSFITQNARVGAHAHLGMGALVAGHIDIRAEVEIGTHAILRSGVTLGRGSRVGAGAVVQRDLHPFESVSVRPATAASAQPAAS